MNGRLKIPLIIFALAAVGVLVYFTGRVCLVIFMGVVLAVALDALARGVRYATRLPHGWSLLVVVTVILGVSTGASFLIGPMISNQFEQMSEKVPQAVGEIESWLSQRGWGQMVLSQVPDSIEGMGDEGEAGGDSGESRQGDGEQATGGGDASPASDAARRSLLFPRQHRQEQSDAFTGTDLLSQLTGVFSVTLSTLVNVAVLVVVGLYLAAEPQLYRRGAMWLVPKRHDAVADKLLKRISRALRWWLLGRILSMTVVGVMTGVGLWLLGLPLAFVLGLIAGLLSFIPNLGPILAAIPGILIGLMQGPWMAVWVAAIYTGVQFFESYLITPLIQERAVSIPPALLLTVQLVMGVLAGVWGLLAATPLMVTVIVTIQTLYVRRQLHKPVPIMGSQAGRSASSGVDEEADDDDDDDDQRDDRPRQ